MCPLMLGSHNGGGRELSDPFHSHVDFPKSWDTLDSLGRIEIGRLGRWVGRNGEEQGGDGPCQGWDMAKYIIYQYPFSLPDPIHQILDPLAPVRSQVQMISDPQLIAQPSGARDLSLSKEMNVPTQRRSAHLTPCRMQHVLQ